MGIFSVLKEKRILGKGCCFQDLCLEDFAMVCLGSLGRWEVAELDDFGKWDHVGMVSL